MRPPQDPPVTAETERALVARFEEMLAACFSAVMLQGDIPGLTTVHFALTAFFAQELHRIQYQIEQENPGYGLPEELFLDFSFAKVREHLGYLPRDAA